MKKATIQLLSTGLYLLLLLFSAVMTPVASGNPLYLYFAEPTGFIEPGTHAVLEWTADPGKTYLVQSADALTTPSEWTTEEPVTKSSVGPLRWMAPESIREKKFYRLILPQPEVHALEPALIDSGDTNALFYLMGQCLPTNGYVVVNGQSFTVVASDTNETWIAVSLDGLPPGTPVTGTLQVLDAGSNLVTTVNVLSPVFYGSAPTDEQLQGPPEVAPAGPGALRVEHYGLRSNLYPFTVNRTGGNRGYRMYKKRKFAEQELEEREAELAGGIGGITIHPAAGEVRCEQVDLAIPGRGMDLVWTRTYRSRTGPVTEAGHGWDYSYNVRLAQQPDGTVKLWSGNGRCDTFYPDSTNGWYRNEYFVSIRDLNGDGMPDVLFPDTGRWLFNPAVSPAAGKLDQIIDRNGNTIRCEYDGAGRLTAVVDTLSRTNTVQYGLSGFIESVTDHSGRQVRYEYDVHSNLVACISPAVIGTPNGNDFPGGKTNLFAYTSGISDERLNHNLTGMTDGKGQTQVQLTYATNLTPSSVDFDSVATLVRGGQHTDYWRERQTAVPDNGYAVIRCIANDYVGNVTDDLYDASRRLVLRREYTGRAHPSLPTTKNANQPIGKVRPTDPDYFETGYEWNADSLCTRIIYPAGNVTEMVYQRAFQSGSSTTNRSHDGDLRILREIAANGQDDDGDGETDTLEWRFEYDARFGSPRLLAKDVTTSTTAGAKTEVFVMDARLFSDSVSGGSGPGGGQSTAHNPLNRPAYMNFTADFSDGRFVTRSVDPRLVEFEYEYDASGNRTRIRKRHDLLAAEWEELIDYNSHGQIITITNAIDTRGRASYDVYLYGEVPGALNTAVFPTNIIIDAGGEALSTHYEYDSLSRVTRVIDPRGNDRLFIYNELDQLVQAESAPYGSGGGGSGGRIAVHYAYDENDNLVRVDQDNLDLDANPNPVNPTWTTRYVYDILDRRVEVVDEIDEGPGGGTYVTNRFEYDGNDNVVRCHSGEAAGGIDTNSVIQFIYDERDLLACTIEAPGTPIAGANEGFVNVNGQVSKTQRSADDGSKFDSAFYEYDGFDRLIRVRDAFGNTVHYGYDRNSNLILEQTEGELIDGSGTNANVVLAETHYVYDSLDRRIRRDDLHFDAASGAPAGDGARTTLYTYAPNGQLDHVVNDNNHALLYDYDSAGRLISVTDDKTNVVSYAYDDNGNMTNGTQLDRSDLTPGVQQFVTSYEYDALNRLIRTVDSVSNTNQYRYDSRHNLVRHTNPAGDHTWHTYDGLRRRTLSAADFDRDGLLDLSVDVQRSYVYDLNSRLITSTDDNTNTTTYAYDSRNRCIQISEADSTARYLTWSPRSNLIQTQDANGTVVSNAYDLLDRCIDRIITPGAAVAASTTYEQYSYDGLSRMILASNDLSRVEMAYDSLGNKTEEIQDGSVSSYTYDGVGNRLSLAYPSGRLVTYGYDALNRVVSIDSSTGGPSSPVATYVYDGMDRVRRITRGNNITTTLEWNGALNPPNPAGDFGTRQISSITDEDLAIGVVVDQRLFTYDRNQNKTLRIQGAPFFPGGPVTTNLFFYDPLDRMTEFTRERGFTNDLFISHLLDGNGNRINTTSNGFVFAYTMDPTLPAPGDFQMNQYTFTPYVFAPQQYDENGNLAERVTAAKQLVYTYDYADRLIDVVDMAAGFPDPVATYTYDALGRRITRTAPGLGIDVDYIYDGAQIIEERDAFGIAGKSFVLDGTTSQDDGDIRDFNWTQTGGPFRFGIKNIPFIGSFTVSMSVNGQDYYYHTDDLGNALALTDASGNVVERYEYDDYGAPQFLTAQGAPSGGSSSLVGNPFLFHGMLWDDETGLYIDSGSGPLDPEIGRTISGKRKALCQWITESPWSPRDAASGLATGKRQHRPTMGQMGNHPNICQFIGGLHDEGIIHRDIAARNILIDSSGGGPAPAIESRDLLKSFYETGDKPTQAQFVNLIDSMINMGGTGDILKGDDGGRHTPFYNKYRPRVSDFGMSRVVEVETIKFTGTMGQIQSTRRYGTMSSGMQKARHDAAMPTIQNMR